MKEKIDKDKIIAAIATLLVCLLLLICLFFSSLYYSFPPDGQTIPDKEEIMFGGEFVMLGNTPELADADLSENAQTDTEQSKVEVNESQDIEDSGEIGETEQPNVAAEVESPMKEKVKPEEPKKKGPTKEELAEQQRIKEEKEKAKKISQRVSFNNTSGESSGRQGQPDGNADVGVRSGAPGVTGLAGYTIERWERPKSPYEGKLVIRVRVNARGRVVEARYVGGQGPASSNATVRRSCEQASLKSQFKVPNHTTTEGVGDITWHFE